MHMATIKQHPMRVHMTTLLIDDTFMSGLDKLES